MTTLAEAAILVKPDFRQVGPGSRKAGESAGAEYGDGFKRGADGKLRDHRGKFVEDPERQGKDAGGKFGKGFGDSAHSGIVGKLKETAKFTAGLLIPVGIGAAVKEILTIGTAYEDNLNIFQAVTKATGQQMDQVAAKARQLGADTKLPGVSAAGAAESMTELAKSGLSVAQSMDAARATLQLARAAGIDEAKAAEITGNAINTFGLKAKDATMVVDQLAATANSSSVEIGDVSDAFQMAAAVFSGFQGPAVGAKETITELNTAIAILGNNGIKGSDAGTSLKQMMLQLTGPSKKAAGVMDGIALSASNASGAMNEFFMPVKGKGGKLEQLDTGMTIYKAILTGTSHEQDVAIDQLDAMNPKLKDIGSVAFDSAGKMRSLPQILDILSKGLKDATQEEKAAALTTVFGADATRSVIALMKGGLPVYDAQRKAVLQVGAAADVAAAKNKGLRGSIDNVRSQLENAAISVYTTVKGPLTKALNGLADRLPPFFNAIGAVFDFLGHHMGTIKTLAVTIGVLTLAVKAHSFAENVSAAGGFVRYLVQTITQTKIAATVTKVWAAAEWLMVSAARAAGIAFRFMIGPVGLIITAVGLLAAGLIYLFNHNKTFHDFVIKAWAAIKDAVAASVNWIVGTAWPWLQKAWSAIKAGAVDLWHGMQGVWHGIMDVVHGAVNVVQTAIGNAKKSFTEIGHAATALYDATFKPVFHAIGWAVHSAWVVIEVTFAIFKLAMKGVGVAATWLYDRSIRPIFALIARVIAAAVNRIEQTFADVRAGFRLVADWFSSVWNTKIRPFFRDAAQYIADWWNSHIKPVWNGMKAGWSALSTSIRAVWNGQIKPMFTAFVDYVQRYVVNGFRGAVGFIKTAWNAVKDAVKAPIVFAVDYVLNPLINGFNRIAGAVGVKDRIDPIHGLAEGGRIPGPPSSRDNRVAWLKDKAGRTVGNLAVATGEFIVNARDTARALPLLQWINDGMRGGPSEVAKRLGRPVVSEPGDGSEGWAFASGGLVGFLKDVWGAMSNPAKLIKAPIEAALSRIPGEGMIRDFLLGMGHKLIGGLTHFLGGSGGAAPGTVGKAQAFVRAQDGKPYVWASAGPYGYDCSGIVSAVYNILHGRNPYSHTFSTESAGRFFTKPGLGGPLVAGWSHPGQAPASASVGHMMGMVGGLQFESTGSRGVHIGNTTRHVTDFANVGHFADGGLLRVAKLASADFGRVTLAPGMNLVHNGTGAPEPLATAAQSRMHPDDIDALAYALAGALGGVLMGTVPASRAAARQIGKRPR